MHTFDRQFLLVTRILLPEFPTQTAFSLLKICLSSMASRGGARGVPLPPQNFPRDVMSLHWSPTQTIGSSPCCKTGPSSGPPKWKCLAPPLMASNEHYSTSVLNSRIDLFSCEYCIVFGLTTSLFSDFSPASWKVHATKALHAAYRRNYTKQQCDALVTDAE